MPGNVLEDRVAGEDAVVRIRKPQIPVALEDDQQVTAQLDQPEQDQDRHQERRLRVASETIAPARARPRRSVDSGFQACRTSGSLVSLGGIGRVGIFGRTVNKNCTNRKNLCTKGMRSAAGLRLQNRSSPHNRRNRLQRLPCTGRSERISSQATA